MKKGDMPLSLIIGLIILLVGVSVFAYVIKQGITTVDRSANVEAVRTWALVQSQTQKLSTERAGKEHPPIPNLGSPVVIKNEEELKKSHKQIADAMVDCWTAFHKGEVNFLQAIYEKPFCYPCVPIKIADSLKGKGYVLVGLNTYLATTKIRSGKDAPTYLEYLTGEKNLPVGVKDAFVVNDDMHVMYVAKGGRKTWEFLKTAVIGVDEDDSAVEDAFRAQIGTVAAEGGVFYAKSKADAFLKIDDLQKNPEYKAAKGEISRLEGELKKVKTQLDDLLKAQEKLLTSQEELLKTQKVQNELLKQLATSQSKVGELETVALKSAKGVVTAGPLSEGQVLKEMSEEYQYTQGKISEINSRLKGSLTAGQKVALEQELGTYTNRLVKIEDNIARASSKAVVRSTGEALIVTTEQTVLTTETAVGKIAGKTEEAVATAGKVAEVADKGVIKAVGKTVKRTFAKTAVRFVPLVGQAIFIADIGYSSYKIFFGDRLFSATIMIDESKVITEVCNPVIKETEERINVLEEAIAEQDYTSGIGGGI